MGVQRATAGTVAGAEWQRQAQAAKELNPEERTGHGEFVPRGEDGEDPLSVLNERQGRAEGSAERSPETSRDALKRERALAQDFFQGNGVQAGESCADARLGSCNASQRRCAAREVVVLLAFRFRQGAAGGRSAGSAAAARRPLPRPPRS